MERTGLAPARQPGPPPTRSSWAPRSSTWTAARLLNTSSCTGDSCLATIVPGSSQTFRVQHVDFRDSDFFGISDRQWRNGVRVAKVDAAEERAGALTGYGAWGRFNAALYGVESGVTADAMTSVALTASSGTAAGSNPVAGAATWGGAMVGVTLEDDDLGEAVMGDADLAVDFANATLDLALTEIAGISTGAARDDIIWTDVPMSAGAWSAEGP